MHRSPKPVVRAAHQTQRERGRGAAHTDRCRHTRRDIPRTRTQTPETCCPTSRLACTTCSPTTPKHEIREKQHENVTSRGATPPIFSFSPYARARLSAGSLCPLQSFATRLRVPGEAFRFHVPEARGVQLGHQTPARPTSDRAPDI